MHDERDEHSRPAHIFSFVFFTFFLSFVLAVFLVVPSARAGKRRSVFSAARSTTTRKSQTYAAC
jgi:hypothetical protein